MQNYVNESLRELTKHGTNEFKAAIYGDSYRYVKNRFYYAHYHEEYEIIVAKYGDILIEVGEEGFLLKENDILFINTNIVHRISHDDYPNTHVITFLFHPSLINTTGSSFIDHEIIKMILSKDFHGIKLNDPLLYQNLLTLYKNERHKEKGNQLDYLIAIYQVLSFIYKNYDSLDIRWNSSLGTDRIREALSYIYANFDKEISVSDIAKKMNLSIGEASRAFKKSTGKSPMEYVIDYRMNMASFYLKSTDKSITEISYLVGFSSSNYFTIQFKKINGITPKQFRLKGK